MSIRSLSMTALIAALASVLLGQPPAAQAAPQTAQLLPASDGCAVPPPASPLAGLVLAFPQVGSDGLFQIPPATAQPHLVISCLQFDRSGYRQGEAWGATLTVTNAGNAISSAVTIYAQMCRHMSDGNGFSCSVSVFPLVSSEAPLEAGESRALVHPASFGFSALDPDPPDEYQSWVDGLPDNGTVYLRANVSGLGEYTIASAIYPSGPEALQSASEGSVDADEDGYATPEDCNDDNYRVHPGATEIVNDGIDQDCASGDVSPTPSCPGGSVIYYGQCLDSAPGEVASPGILDLDGDGFSVQEEDCDDSQFNVHPEAVEIQDGLDNNCNGETDEVLGIPDFTLTAEVTEGTNPHPYVGGVMEPGLHYLVEVQNLGAGIPVPLEAIQAVSVATAGDGITIATGTSGFLPFRLMPYTACAGGTIRFSLADNGIYGETNFANNVFELPYEGEGLTGGPDRDITFDDQPGVLYDDDPDPSVGVSASWVAQGMCPPVPTNSLGTNPMVSARHRVWVNGTLIHNGTTFNDLTWADLSERLHRLDRVCAEVVLNDPYLVPEGTANNAWVGAYEFRNPVFGPGELQRVDSAIGAPYETVFGIPRGLSCVDWSAGETDTPIVGATGGVLTGSSTAAPYLGGLGGALLIGVLGASLGWFAGRRFAGLPTRVLATAGGLSGLVIGGLAGALLLNSLADSAREPTVLGPPDPGEIASLPSCDQYLDPSSASPADGTIFFPGGPLLVDLDPVPGVDPLPDAYSLSVGGPSGQSFSPPWGAESADPAPLDLVQAAYRYPASFVFSPGQYTWSILAGLRAGNGNDVLCRDSTSHTFVIQGLTPVPALILETPAAASPTPLPSSTPATPRVVPTTPAAKPATPTHTPVPDTAGPSIKSVSDSPDPIKVSQPKGCSPTTSTVTARIIDPSGVASAYVLFFHTTIGQVPMANSGGDTWTATLGPFPGIGDGTLDYQIHALDTEGNATDSAFGQITVLACLP